MTWALLPATACLLLLTACSATKQSRKVQTSGFLSDYSQLREGEKNESLLIYVDESAPWGSYSNLLLEPVTIWYGGDYKLDEVPLADLQEIATYFHQVMTTELEKEFTLVEHTGPGTIRMRVGITDARPAKVVRNSVTSIVPQLRLISSGKKLASGTHAFVGRCGVEMEVLDGLTNRRVTAGVDHRAGGKSLKNAFGKWSDVKSACDKWAEQYREKLVRFAKEHGNN